MKPDTAMDEALEADPPVIEWYQHKGVQVGVVIHDPHAETTVQAQAERLRDAALIAMREDLIAMQDEAREVAARFERHRADNTPLLAAARKEI